MRRRTLLFSTALWMACGNDDDPKRLGPGSTSSGSGGSGGTPLQGCAAVEPIAIPVPGGDSPGTLVLPEACEPVPVALLHVGSGPTDRDGNSVGLPVRNDSLKLLAEGLAARGIAAVRYDKRLIAEASSLGPAPEDLRFDDYVADLALWIAAIRADARFSKLTVIGHSEGSLIAIRALQQAPADAFVSLAGAGRTGADILREQLAKNLPAALLDEANTIIDELEAGRTVPNVSDELLSLFAPQNQGYIISWFQYDPAVEIAKIETAAQIVGGTTDIQIPVMDAEILAAAKPGSNLVIIDGMSHVLKEATLDDASQNAAYGDPSLPVMPELFDALVPFAS